MNETETKIANGILAELSSLTILISSQPGGVSTPEQQLCREKLIGQYRDFLDSVSVRQNIHGREIAFEEERRNREEKRRTRAKEGAQS